MSRSLRAYRGLWQKELNDQTAIAAPPLLDLGLPPATSRPLVARTEAALSQASAPAGEATEAVLSKLTFSAAANLRPISFPLQRERQRQKLGEQLLALEALPRFSLIFGLSLGSAAVWREWSHQRLFALTCATQIELPVTTLKQVRQNLGWWRYAAVSRALCHVLRVYAGPRRMSWHRLLLVRLVPPLFVWTFERQLQSLRGLPAGAEK